MAAEPRKMLPDQWYFGKPAVYVHAEQFGDIRGRKVKSFGIQIAGSGSLPIGVSTACTWPSQRSKIHFSTRLFSPYPGHRNFPLSPVRNQFT
jgi:hypothetical protein